MGQLIEWYHPAPKPPRAEEPVVEETTDQMPAADLQVRIGVLKDSLNREQLMELKRIANKCLEHDRESSIS